VIEFTQQNIDFIRFNLSKYLFSNYQHNGDLIAKYSTFEEIQSEIEIEAKSKAEIETHSHVPFDMNYLSIRSPLFPRLLFIFLTGKTNDPTTYSARVLSRITNSSATNNNGQATINQVVLSMFSDLPGLGVPFMVKPGEINNIEEIVNNIIRNFRDKQSPLLNQEFQIMYGKDHRDINKMLRNIIIKVPSTDLQTMIANNQQQSPIIDSINEFLYNNTKVNFAKLTIVRFSSGVINIAQEGRFKIFGDQLGLLGESMCQQAIWLLIESILTE
jgi:hypothetical protein